MGGVSASQPQVGPLRERAAPLWIALYLPELPLQAAGRGLLVDLPFAVIDGPEERPLILAANAVARASGIHTGMPLGAARALAANLTAWRREVAREDALLNRAALAAMHFSPMVTLAVNAVLLEVAPSLMLFRGLKALAQRIKRELARAGVRAVAACAPAPRAAWLLAHARACGVAAPHVRQLPALPVALAGIPLDLTGWPQEVTDALLALGIAQFGDLPRLPRDGIARRFGKPIVEDIERILGERADPRQTLLLQERFATRLELVCETDDSAQVLHAAGLLFGEAEDFLRARGQATTRLELVLEHGRHRATPLMIGTREAVRDPRRWRLLLREQLARQPLEDTVCALSLVIDSMQAYQAVSGSFFSDPSARAGNLDRLAEQLLARMGAGSIVMVEEGGDHRPEKASHEVVHGVEQGRKMYRPHRGQERKSEDGSAMLLRPSLPANEVPSRPIRSASAAPLRPPMPASAAPPRPIWLLRQPRSLILLQGEPVHRGALRHLAGPERIETGWWDGAPARRDYYVMANREGETLWVFHDLARGGWYLHGFFA